MAPPRHHRRAPPTRGRIKALACGMVAASACAALYERWDATVAGNLAFRATKSLDLVFRPATKDPNIHHVRARAARAARKPATPLIPIPSSSGAAAPDPLRARPPARQRPSSPASSYVS